MILNPQDEIRDNKFRLKQLQNIDVVFEKITEKELEPQQCIKKP